MRKILLLAAALIFAVAPANAQNAPAQSEGGATQRAQAQKPRPIDSERLAMARKMMQTTGADRIAGQIMRVMMPQITGMLVRARPDKKKEITELMQEVAREMSSRAGMQQLIDHIARIYAEEFTADEMRRILAFYDTPVGRKLISRMPSIIMRSQQAGRAWGQQVARKAIQRIRQKAKERGIDL